MTRAAVRKLRTLWMQMNTHYQTPIHILTSSWPARWVDSISLFLDLLHVVSKVCLDRVQKEWLLWSHTLVDHRLWLDLLGMTWRIVLCLGQPFLTCYATSLQTSSSNWYLSIFWRHTSVAGTPWMIGLSLSTLRGSPLTRKIVWR